MYIYGAEESNWRNDYPDEDEWRSDTSSEYGMSSDNECYRYQPIGKHGTMLASYVHVYSCMYIIHNHVHVYLVSYISINV